MSFQPPRRTRLKCDRSFIYNDITKFLITAVVSEMTISETSLVLNMFAMLPDSEQYSEHCSGTWDPSRHDIFRIRPVGPGEVSAVSSVILQAKFNHSNGNV